jgi:heterodisulfide reductase subunit B
MKLSYYPGCSLRGTAHDYDGSVKAVCAELGIELVELADWNCCGASSAHMTEHELGVRLPLRNLLIAGELGLDVLVPCAACFQRLKAADTEVRKDPKFWDVAGYDPSFKIVHISTLLSSPDMIRRLRERATYSLSGLRIGCYYGCLSLRHPKITDAVHFEQPDSLEIMMDAIGAEPVRWSHRTECCSGSLTMARPDIAARLVGDIVGAARWAGAEALVTDCPMCQANVESRQLELPEDEQLPVYYASELLYAALTGTYRAEQQRVHLVSASIDVHACREDGRAGREERP